MANVGHRDFFKEVAIRSKVSQKTVKKVMNAFIDELWLQLDRENTVRINKLGTFSVKIYSPQRAKDPRTGELIEGIRYKIPKIKFSKALKDYLKWGE